LTQQTTDMELTNKSLRIDNTSYKRAASTYNKLLFDRISVLSILV